MNRFMNRRNGSLNSSAPRMTDMITQFHIRNELNTEIISSTAAAILLCVVVGTTKLTANKIQTYSEQAYFVGKHLSFRS